MQTADISVLEKYSRGDTSVIYTRLPGGIDLFLRGYAHYKDWHAFHQKFFQRINESAKIIAIEGILDVTFKDKLNYI